MSEYQHDINETAQETMNKYESNTDAGDVDTMLDPAISPDPVISPAPDPDFAQSDEHTDAEPEIDTETESSSAVADQEVREV